MGNSSENIVRLEYCMAQVIVGSYSKKAAEHRDFVSFCVLLRYALETPYCALNAVVSERAVQGL